MHKYFLILLVLWISTIGCAHNFKIGVLEKRASYFSTKKQIPKERPKIKISKVSRTRGRVKKAWLHAHEMPTGDYFGGAWVYLLIEETKWSLPENH